MIVWFIPAHVAPPPAPAPTAYRAQYAWGYAGIDGEGRGTLSLQWDPTSEAVVLELHGLGERLLLLTGNRASGYHLQIPRQGVDTQSASFRDLPLPFLPSLGDVKALHRLLTQGEGPGVQASRFDASGPRNLRYRGQDERGHDVTVWLTRKRWESLPMTSQPAPQPE